MNKTNVNKGQIEQSYNNSLMVYKTKDGCFNVELVQYDKLIKFIPDGWESQNKNDREYKRDSGEIRTDSRARTLNNVLDLARSNIELFTTFETLTFNGKEYNAIDLNEVHKYFKTFNDQRKRAFPDYKYLGSVEPQENGNFHFHIMSNISVNSKLLPKRELKPIWKPEKQKWYDLEYYDIPYWNYGFSFAIDITKTDDKFDVVKYIAKYIFKDTSNSMFNRKKVFHSKGLKKKERIKYYKSPHNHSVLDYIKEKDTKSNTVLIKSKSDRKFGVNKLITNGKLSQEQYTELLRLIQEQENE